MNAFDFGDTIVAKSDQLNADDLVGGPITVKITGARRGSADQPLVISLSGGHQPWKPCKTMRRLLAACIGSTSSADLVGRWVTLHRDPTVLWAGQEVGGIRLSAMSGLERRMTVALQVRRGRKAPHHVDPLTPPSSANPDDAAREWLLSAAQEKLGLTAGQVNAWLQHIGSPSLSTMSKDQIRAIASDMPKCRAWADSAEDVMGAPPVAQQVEFVAAGGEE